MNRTIRGVILAVSLCLGGHAALAGEITVQPVEIVETKAVFGRVEPRDLVPARARIGGVLARLDVDEGSVVEQGQVIGQVVDDKLALQLRAAEARLRGLAAEQANARGELERAQTLVTRGAGTSQRVDQFRTQVEVFSGQIAAAEADRAVLIQQGKEGDIVAPASGRVLKVPVTKGAVILPGEVIASVAGGGYFLRLALPERHAGALRVGAAVQIGESDKRLGRLVKLFPQIENGRVIVDIETSALGTFFVGERVMVHVPVARRKVLAVPAGAITRKAGLDLVELVTASGRRHAAVVAGMPVETPTGMQIEILTGLQAGDRVVLP